MFPKYGGWRFYKWLDDTFESATIVPVQRRVKMKNKIDFFWQVTKICQIMSKFFAFHDGSSCKPPLYSVKGDALVEAHKRAAALMYAKPPL